MTNSTDLCAGCRDDYYNTHPPGECWVLKSAKRVRRWRIGWWISPVTPGAFREVETYDCHHEPGRYAFSSELPDHAIDPIPLAAQRAGGKP